VNLIKKFLKIEAFVLQTLNLVPPTPKKSNTHHQQVDKSRPTQSTLSSRIVSADNKSVQFGYV